MTYSLCSSRLLNVFPGMRTPVFLGAMAGAAGGDLAAAVSRAGGMGFIGAAMMSDDVLKKELDKVNAQLGPTGTQEIGVGFLAFRLTAGNEGKLPSHDSTFSSTPSIRNIDIALRARPGAIWLSFAHSPSELIAWTQYIRRRDQEIRSESNGSAASQAPRSGTKYVVLVGEEDQIDTAVQDCQADVVIVQGNEAGGHGYAAAPSLQTMLTTCIPRIRALNPDVPILGAGGLATGRSLASVLAQGADGGVFGTRFLLSPEATYSEKQKNALLGAKTSQTLRTIAFDAARGGASWPAGVDGRGLRNLTVEEYERDGESGTQALTDKYAQAAKEGDISRVVTWSGTGIEAVNEIKPAEQIVREIHNDAVQKIQELASLIR